MKHIHQRFKIAKQSCNIAKQSYVKMHQTLLLISIDTVPWLNFIQNINTIIRMFLFKMPIDTANSDALLGKYCSPLLWLPEQIYSAECIGLARSQVVKSQSR